LFMAYAPVENPRIALALIVENGGWGATVAAPIARKVFDYWLAPGRTPAAQAGEPAHPAAPDAPAEVGESPDAALRPEDAPPEEMPADAAYADAPGVGTPGAPSGRRR